MNSNTSPEFWKEYSKLNSNLKKAAQKAYSIWHENHFHPSLQFKCINSSANIWSVRISRGYRALCVVEENTAIWFWIGKHEGYEKFYR